MTNELAPGREIGRYVLDKYVGGGGFGSAWRAHDTSSGADVAVKFLTGDYTANTAAIRAEVELLAASAASRSEHVVRVLGGGDEPVPHIVMEYIDGTDLAGLLRDKGKLPLDQTLEIGLAVADALRALNEAGIVHRDIKPANVMMDQTGKIKLADFGIAKIVGYETVTMTGQIALTMAYAAPEVWDEEDVAFGHPSHKSDLYALGTLLYQCLMGSTPFQGSYGTLYKAHRERPPNIASLPAEAPASLREIVRHCLAKRQADRPADASECLRYLRRAAIELTEARDEPPAVEPKHFGPWQREAPHPTLPWSWRCRHESIATTATVEVQFLNDLDEGERLRAAIAANPKLVPLGAERLIETNRLILRPGEEWLEPPPGQFQFWLAREDPPTTAPPGLVALGLARQAAAALVELIDAAQGEGLALAFTLENTLLLPTGQVRLLRPGLTRNDDPEKSALEFLRSLPLDNGARELLASATDLRSIAPVRQTFGQASTGEGARDKKEEIELDSVLICARCKAPVAAGEVFCPTCGQRQGRRSEPQCPRCKSPITGDEAFCGNCGERLVAYEPDQVCPHCRGPVASSDPFCGNCGQKPQAEPAARTCSRCQATVPNDQAFCGSCGAPFALPGAATPTESARGGRLGRIRGGKPPSG